MLTLAVCENYQRVQSRVPGAITRGVGARGGTGPLDAGFGVPRILLFIVVPSLFPSSCTWKKKRKEALF